MKRSLKVLMFLICGAITLVPVTVAFFFLSSAIPLPESSALAAAITGLIWLVYLGTWIALTLAAFGFCRGLINERRKSR
jgi:uncharacterized integral membrane protein